jgi:hypothetical protein
MPKTEQNITKQNVFKKSSFLTTIDPKMSENKDPTITFCTSSSVNTASKNG